MRSFGGDSKEWNNSVIKRPRAAASTSVSFLFSRVNELQIIMKTFYAFRFFRSMFSKFDLHLLKQSILRALKRDLERAYLMIVGRSWYFPSCYRRFNLCTAIFYRRVRSMNSEEWLQTFYAFKFFSPNVFNFDLRKIKKGILPAL